MNLPRVSAIVAAYNEAERIGAVLEVLSNTPILDEIIVVDDGSTDSTKQVAQRFGRVTVIAHDENRGKAAAMQSGVERAQGEILFFCDADLLNLTPEMVTQIVEPVVKGVCDMSLGIASDYTQKTVLLISELSGQRAVTRELWNAVEDRYRVGFRIEVGLNQAAHKLGARVSKQVLGFNNTIKERKFSPLEAERERIEMSRDVAVAYTLSWSSRVKKYLLQLVGRTEH